MAYKVKQKRMKAPANEKKWRSHINQLSTAMMSDDGTLDYKKMLEYRKKNFKVLYGSKRTASNDSKGSL